MSQTHKRILFSYQSHTPKTKSERQRERRVNIAALFRFPFPFTLCPSSLTITPSTSSTSIPLPFFFRVRVLTPQWHFHPHSPLQNLSPSSSNPLLPLPRNFLQGRYTPLFFPITEELSFGEGLFAATLSPLMHRLLPIMLPLSPLLSSSRLLLLIVSPVNVTFYFIAPVISLIRYSLFSPSFRSFSP